MTNRSPFARHARHILHLAEGAVRGLADLVRGVHVLPLAHCVSQVFEQPADALALLQAGGWATGCALVIAIEATESVWKTAAASLKA
jgi:hypothetical protein